MERQIRIDELHKILLDEIKIIHEILVTYNIPYYMLGGTMLGAIRHKGFIPWDDDMDIGIPRVHFSEAVDLLKRRLPKCYKIRSINDCDAITTELIKVENVETIITENSKHDLSFTLGVNIDIFPLDKAKTDSLTPLSRNRMIQRLGKLNGIRLHPTTRFSRIISPIIRILLFFTRRDFIVRIRKKLFPVDGEFIMNYYGAWGFKECIPANFFGNPQLYDFEDTQLFGVNNFDGYLSCLYGDYLKLPPENNRHVHIDNVRYKNNNPHI